MRRLLCDVRIGTSGYDKFRNPHKRDFGFVFQLEVLNINNNNKYYNLFLRLHDGLQMDTQVNWYQN